MLSTVTSELMFELYSVPSLTYCVDSIMSFYQNNLPQHSTSFNADGLVISFNTSSTSVVPIVGGRGIMSHAKRYVIQCLIAESNRSYLHAPFADSIPWGASQASEYLLKLSQMKYSTFPTRLTPIQSNVGPHALHRNASDFLSL